MGAYYLSQTILDKASGLSYYLGFSANLSVPNSSAIIALKELTARQQNESACGKNALVFYVPKDQVKLMSDKLLNIDLPTVQVKQVQYHTAVDPTHGKMFCL